ncbi:hypothetical protein ABT275_38135 [Streptomyces sp. NPDC001185]
MRTSSSPRSASPLLNGAVLPAHVRAFILAAQAGATWLPQTT